MKKILAMVILASTMCCMGCGNTAAGNNASNTKAADTPGSTASETASKDDNVDYKTEDINITTADAALKRLKDGNQRFVNDNSQLINVTSERREDLVDGQNPYAVIVSCSDSRITPTTVFDAGLGEIFDVRIAGNVVDNDALGSIEYGALHLNTPLIVVMGHEKCGAVTAAYEKVKNGTPVEGNLNSIVDKIEPNIKDASSLDEAIEENAENVSDLIEDDPLIKPLIDSGKVKVVTAFYDLDGKVTFDD